MDLDIPIIILQTRARIPPVLLSLLAHATPSVAKHATWFHRLASWPPGLCIAGDLGYLRAMINPQGFIVPVQTSLISRCCLRWSGKHQHTIGTISHIRAFAVMGDHGHRRWRSPIGRVYEFVSPLTGTRSVDHFSASAPSPFWKADSDRIRIGSTVKHGQCPFLPTKFHSLTDHH